MVLDQTLRPAFYDDQYLGADDLSATVDYTRTGNARHDLGPHTWGIATGLDLLEQTDASGNLSVSIQPGYAWDGFGRQIVVQAPVLLTPSQFSVYLYDPSTDGGSPPGRLIGVYLQYSELQTSQPGAGFGSCGVNGGFARVQETYVVQIGVFTKTSDLRDNITVGGYSVDAQKVLQQFNTASTDVLYDASVPYQTFPEDTPTALWLVPLGVVRWLPPNAGQPGSFIARAAADLAFGASLCSYAGIVAGSVEPATSMIRMKSRLKQNSSVVTSDLVWVEGSLRAEGNLSLLAGDLQFYNSAGTANNSDPIELQRADTATSSVLEAVIGQQSTGANSFQVGPLNSSGAFQPKLTVLDSGNVGVGTTTPDLLLDVAGDFGHKDGAATLHLWGSTVADTGKGLYLTGGGGVISTDPSSKVGIGTTSPTLLLQIAGDFGRPDGSATVHIFGSTIADTGNGVLKLTSGGGVISTAAGNKVGIGTDTPDLALDIAGDFGHSDGKATMHLWGSIVADTGDGLYLQGGNAVVSTDPNGQVGIATGSPRDTLEVHGDLRLLTNANPLRFTSQWSGFPDSTTNQAEISNDTGGYRALMIVGNKSDGSGDRVVAMWDRLDMNGNLTVSGSASIPGGAWINSSDARLKQNIQALDDGLGRLLKLRGVYFEWAEPARMGNLTGRQIGFIAQDVEPVFPEWVGVDRTGNKTLALRGFPAVATEAIKELHTEVMQQKKRIEALESRSAPPRSSRARKSTGAP